MPDSPVTDIATAATALRNGGVVAYPTEGVYGLGCDPHDEDAVRHLFALKQRPSEQGVLLIAADIEQILPWVERSAVPDTVMRSVYATWPGPHTWIFPPSPEVPDWVRGAHAGIALRVTAHAPAAALARAFGGAIVSTSANPHGYAPASDAARVAQLFPAGLAAIVDAPLGGLNQPTPIRDAVSGATIRA